MSMSMTNIPNIIPFPDGAESSPFFGALASVLTPALGYTEDMPYFCDPKQSYCVNCGNCKNSTMQKHRIRIYHDYQTFCGVSLGWVWPEGRSEFQTLPGWREGWRWPDDFLSYLFGYAGLSWKRLVKSTSGRATGCVSVGASKAAILEAVKASVVAGIPVLMKLSAGPDWHVVTGYDENGTLYGLDSHKHFDHTMRPTRATVAARGYTDDGLFILSDGDWYDYFDNAIVIIGKAAKSVTYLDVLDRMICTLAHPAHALLEQALMARLDAVTSDNALETAQWLLSMVGFPIEGRYHAADSNLHNLCENAAAKEKIFGMIRQYVFDSEHDATHGTCWKIWAQLGVGAETGYALPPNAAALLLNKDTRNELKRLFKIVFENDRVVLKLLKEAAAIIK
ncbi:MAG: hypothetical protein FWH01_11935 [Oscillospiraceae bacterium]|nr:hypothetical protein [Oscillospiraceae bacterium]